MNEIELKYYAGNDSESRSYATAIYDLISDCFGSLKIEQYTKEEVYVDNETRDLYNKGMVARVDVKTGKFTVKGGKVSDGIFNREEVTYPNMASSGALPFCETQFEVTVNRKVNTIKVGKRSIVEMCLYEVIYSVDKTPHYEVEFELVMGDVEALETIRNLVDKYIERQYNKVTKSTISKGERGYQLMGI